MSRGGADLLEVRDLTIAFPAGEGLLLAADRIDLQVAAGRTVGLVGESGCGKSVTLRSLLGLVPYPGEVLCGRDPVARRGPAGRLQAPARRRCAGPRSR